MKEDHKEGTSPDDPDILLQEPKSRRSWWIWSIILLLPITYLLPIWGESLQVELIGYEGFCCMPDNWQELMQKSERAKSMRLESNLIIGTGILLAVILLNGIIFVLYKYAVPCIKNKRMHLVSQFLVGVLITPFILFLFLAVIMFVFYNDEYHETRYQPPRDNIYSYAIDFVIPWPLRS